MRRIIAISAGVISLALAQSVTVVRQGEVAREDYHYVVESVKRVDVDIEYGLGELIISANPEGTEIDGFIEYSPRFMTPKVSYRTAGSKGKLDVEVQSSGHDWDAEERDYNYDYDEVEEDDRNRWSFDFDWRDIRDGEYLSIADFRLPQSLPTDIQIEFGLGEARIDLSDLSVSQFEMDCGLGDTRIIMSTPNPVTCREVNIEAAWAT